MHMRGKTICEFTVIIWDAAFTTWPEGGPFFSCARRRASDAHSPGMAQYSILQQIMLRVQLYRYV